MDPTLDPTSTKTLQIQGADEQLVKRHLDQLIFTSHGNGVQVDMEDEGSAAQVEIEVGGAIEDESAELVSPSDPDTGSQTFESSVVNENSTLSVTEDLAENSEPDPDSRSRDRTGHCHGCASLDSRLGQLRHHFQSEIDSLKETVLNCTANLNFPPSHVAASADSTKLLKENHELQP